MPSYAAYAVHMTATQKPTELGASILEAIKLAGVSQIEAHDALGISYATWRKRLASDKFTMNDLMKTSGLTGISLYAILTREMVQVNAA